MNLSILSAARETPEALALILGEEAFSYAALAARLQPKLGELADWPHDAPYPLVCHPHLDALVTLWAAFELALPVGLIHPRLPDARQQELRRRLLAIRPHEIQGTRRALVLAFTSGTVGQPKAVELSRAAFLASAAAHTARMGWKEDDRWVLALPFAHVGGLSVLTRSLLARRPVVVVKSDVGFSPERFCASLARHRVTIGSLVPSQLAQILDRMPGFCPPPFLRAILLGGAGASLGLLHRAADRGWPILTSYGLTETCSQQVTQRLGTVNRGELGVGDPLPGVELRILEGGIQIRTSTLMTGYHPMQPFLTEDGWFETGDLGRLDEQGHLHVLGRKDDLIITGGEKVIPWEVERALEDCEGIQSACVFGLEDPLWGQCVAAVVVGVDPPAPELLAAHLAPRLASFQRPRLVAFLEQLPLNPSGKVDRHAAAQLSRERFIRLRFP